MLLLSSSNYNPHEQGNFISIGKVTNEIRVGASGNPSMRLWSSKYLRRTLNGFRLRFNGQREKENQRKVGIFDIKNIGKSIGFTTIRFH